MKKYRLLQEYRTPKIIIKPGAIFTEFGTGYEYQLTDLSTCYLGRLPVENTPDWFEEVKDEPMLPVDWQQQQDIQMQKEINEKFFRQLIKDMKNPAEHTTAYLLDRILKLEALITDKQTETLIDSGIYVKFDKRVVELESAIVKIYDELAKIYQISINQGDKITINHVHGVPGINVLYKLDKPQPKDLTSPTI